MSRKLYELTVKKEGRDVREVEPYLVTLDLRDAEEAEELISRHILAAAERSGERRDRAHLFSVEAREADEDGRAWGDPKWRWALPVDDRR